MSGSKMKIWSLLLSMIFISCSKENKTMLDNYQWLEEIESPKSLSWISLQNERTLGELEKDSSYKKYFKVAKNILTSKDRITYAKIRGDYAYNFWRGQVNVRGLWRRTKIQDYISGKPQWETLLDIDKLAKMEKENWVYKYIHCLAPRFERCLLSLSKGGKDASIIREFDLVTKSFVKNGFYIPEAKSMVAWFDENHLLIGTRFNEKSSLTDSGYPRIIKLWKRGTPLDQAVLILEGNQQDIFVYAFQLRHDEQVAILLSQKLDLYHSKYWLLHRQRKIPLNLPTHIKLLGLFKGQIIINLLSAWKTYKAGSLISFDLNHFIKTNKLGEPANIFIPSRNMSGAGATIGRNHVFVGYLEDVKSRLRPYDFKNGRWINHPAQFFKSGSYRIISSNFSSRWVLIDYSDFLHPNSLYILDDIKMRPEKIRALPVKFDARDLKVEQNMAVSKDGTKIPYFLVSKKNIQLTGKNPTLLYGYGGFEHSMVPYYSPILGKLWLEKGGAYVVANIRGGGEYGPKWHQDALKKNRQKSYDDFISVAEDLIKRKITSPKHLGISGWSNGGLLVGVAFTQRPDLFNAVICGAPLLDMLRYHKLLAGASWMAEYGDPNKSDERKALMKYSPYHNISLKKTYPKIFFLTSTKDDRVHPGHARKMAAKMAAQKHPFYYYENTEGGHSASANLLQRARIEALQFVYLDKQLR